MNDNLEMLQLFYRVAHAINGSLDLNDTLQAILHTIQENLSVHAVVIRLLSPNADTMEVAASTGVSQEFLSQVSPKIMPDGIYQQVLDGQTIHIADLKSARSNNYVATTYDLPDSLLDSEQIGGVLVVPLQVRARPIGSLTLYSKLGDNFDQDDITLVSAIGDLAAVAIENARLHTSLFRIAQALTSTLELQPLLDQVLAATVLEMGLKAASVRLLDASGKRLELVAAHGLSERYLAKGAITVAKSLIDQKLLAGESVVLYNVAEDPGFQYPAEAKAEGIRSVLAVPLRVKEKIVGVMRVYSAQPRPFTPIGIKFLESVAGLVAVAIENAKLYQALQARYEDLKLDVSEWYRFLSLG